jgi:hypothetical protein
LTFDGGAAADTRFPDTRVKAKMSMIDPNIETTSLLSKINLDFVSCH